MMASVSPISPGAGELRPVTPVKPASIAVQPEPTSAQEDVISLSPEAVQLIQAGSLSGYENQQVTDGAAGGNTPAESAPGTTLEFVG